MQTITGKLQPLQSSLQKIGELDRQCEEANTEENDYTIYSVEDLKFELTLVQKAVQKKSAFIENQVRLSISNQQREEGTYFIQLLICTICLFRSCLET